MYAGQLDKAVNVAVLDILRHLSPYNYQTCKATAI
jgi:hypothetical protein